MTLYFEGGSVELDLSTRRAAMADKEKIRKMDEEGAFDHAHDMPEAAYRNINRKYPPRPDWEGLGISKDAAIRPSDS